MNVILIDTDGSISEKNVKSLDKLYSVCGYRTNKDFEKLYEWVFDKNIYELYGKKSGKIENNYIFPKDKKKYYGKLCIIKTNGSIILDEWNIFYMSFTNDDKMNETESIDSEDSSNSVLYYNHMDELNYEEYEDEP